MTWKLHLYKAFGPVALKLIFKDCAERQPASKNTASLIDFCKHIVRHDEVRNNPSIGSLITYWLGTENRDFHGFVRTHIAGETPYVGKASAEVYSGPSLYHGIQCRAKCAPVLNI